MLTYTFFFYSVIIVCKIFNNIYNFASYFMWALYFICMGFGEIKCACELRILTSDVIQLYVARNESLKEHILVIQTRSVAPSGVSVCTNNTSRSRKCLRLSGSVYGDIQMTKMCCVCFVSHYQVSQRKIHFV